MKHTKGPWEIEKYSTADKYIYIGPGISLDYDDVDHAEQSANAKLIAAAPELLRELKHLVRLMEPIEKEGGLNIPGLATLNGARLAIQKATS